MYFDKLLKKLILDDVEIDNRLALAPMAGVTDQPFRTLCKRMGCGLLVSEMVSAKGLVFENARTWELLVSSEIEQPFAVQLFGSDPATIAEAALAVQQRGVRLVDLNMGCPVPKVVNAGEGSALMKQPHLVEKIVSSTVKTVSIPVTVKIRKGWNDENINCCEIAKIVESAGASAIAVHARTREQFYSGVADWSVIAAVKACVKIPVFGNGDIFSGRAAIEMMRQTNCDAVMIGRGAMGNPWLFREVLHFAKTGEMLPAPEVSERVALIIEQLTALIKLKGESRAIKEMRSHAAWYTKGLRNAALMRQQFNKAISSADFVEAFLATPNN
ncbi:MAG: tRNA dihydrouridine synthase DusB [Negativicutes bacterium]|jgi:tRNA-dihydrouridine synthase B